uniref:Uncharacterized protein n=1 Tax=Onchocerca volvulus TaxID=6282 RepID=A0A8R1XSM0_ONCVO
MQHIDQRDQHVITCDNSFKILLTAMTSRSYYSLEDILDVKLSKTFLCGKQNFKDKKISVEVIVYLVVLEI